MDYNRQENASAAAKHMILFIATILGCLLLYLTIYAFEKDPVQSIFQHKDRGIIFILICVVIGEWVALSNDMLAVYSPLNIFNMRIFFNLIDWRAGSAEIPNYNEKAIRVKTRLYIVYPLFIIIPLMMLLLTIKNG